MCSLELKLTLWSIVHIKTNLSQYFITFLSYFVLLSVNTFNFGNCILPCLLLLFMIFLHQIQLVVYWVKSKHKIIRYIIIWGILLITQIFQNNFFRCVLFLSYFSAQGFERTHLLLWQHINWQLVLENSSILKKSEVISNLSLVFW